MAVRREEERKAEEKKPIEFRAETYLESARALREAVPRIILTVGAALLTWVFGTLVFMPIAQGIYFMGYPVPQIISFIIVVALAILILSVFVDIRRLTKGLAGIFACISQDFGCGSGHSNHHASGNRCSPYC